jgi:glutamate-1-semialdehyde 2,1-aminomutase
MTSTIFVTSAVVLALVASLPILWRRLELSRAKHPSLAGHSRLAKRIARLVPYYAYDGEQFYGSDGAPADVVAARHRGFQQLSDHFSCRFAKSIAATREAADGISDLQFTGRNRVPFQYSAKVRGMLPVGAFLRSSSGVQVTDLDGNLFYDLTGSYGVNVFGVDFYKECIAEGSARVNDLGPVLGPLHPSVSWNVRRLKEISGLDEVSFHMSGTEAVMQAVRLARYHTGRDHLVRFCGAYHGWWEDVQPGIGNPLQPGKTYTLKDMHSDSLRVLRHRRDIACVLVNPLQALHPNANASGDSALVDGSRRAHFDRAAYSAWLRELREVCTQRRIVLIFDEIFVGFRLAPGGAQEYFGVRADMVTYGKTLGGGLPVGVLCGRADLMKRFREDRPADICFARGTFNSHPYVMGAMQVFLERLGSPEIQSLYARMDDRWNSAAQRLNARLEGAELPVRVANLSSIWTVVYTRPSRYHWMLQYYLRAEGLALSWVGTGRIIFSLNYGDDDLEEVMRRFVSAALKMLGDGWWWHDEGLTDQSIRRTILREMIAQRLRGPLPVPLQRASRAGGPAPDRSADPASGTAVPGSTA